MRKLSTQDMQRVVEKGCPNLFRKVVNSAKRLRIHLNLDEGEVCGGCNLRGSCDRVYLILKESEGVARTVDNVRVLLIYAFDSAVISNGAMPPGSELIEISARQLLSGLVELSETLVDPEHPTSAPRASPRKKQSVGSRKDLIGLEVKSSAELEEEMMAKIPKFKARPLNKKILEVPTLPALPKSTPQLPEFKEFHLQTMARANQNAETSTVASIESTQPQYVVELWICLMVSHILPLVWADAYENIAAFHQAPIRVSETEALYELFEKINNAVIDDGLINKEEFQLALIQDKQERACLLCLTCLAQSTVDSCDLRSLPVHFLFSIQMPLSMIRFGFSFQLYELKQQGFIERQEVKQMVVATLAETGLNLSDEIIESIIDKRKQEMIQASVDLQLKDPLPVDWEQCLDIESGSMCYLNRKTLRKTWDWPKDQKLDLELNMSSSFNHNHQETMDDNHYYSKKQNKSSSSGSNSSMVALTCSNCHLLVSVTVSTFLS